MVERLAWRIELLRLQNVIRLVETSHSPDTREVSATGSGRHGGQKHNISAPARTAARYCCWEMPVLHVLWFSEERYDQVLNKVYESSASTE